MGVRVLPPVIFEQETSIKELTNVPTNVLFDDKPPSRVIELVLRYIKHHIV